MDEKEYLDTGNAEVWAIIHERPIIHSIASFGGPNNRVESGASFAIPASGLCSPAWRVGGRSLVRDS